MKKIIIAYRHLIILIWLILILLIFKITTNFKFKNGSSLVFIGLIIIVPLIIYTYSFINIKKNKETVKINKDGYYQTIVKDLEKGNFQTNFLDKLSNLNLKYLCNHLDVLIVKIINHNQDILKVTFSQNQATLEILDTKIIYHFYYSHIIDEFTKYDIRNFEYKEPTVLYSKILEKINFLINKEYIYTYTKKQVSLITTLDNVEVYNVKVNKKLFEKENKNHKTITL